MKRKLLLGVLVALVTSLPLASALGTHSWNGFHWEHPSVDPLSLTVVKSVTPAWNPAVDTAIADWGVSTVIDLTPVLGSTANTARKKCAPVRGQIRVCNASYGRNGWLGIAEIWINADNHIVQGRTKLNDSYYSLSYYNTPAWRSLVACQEIGHDFGLDHQDETMDNAPLGSCMDYSNDPTPNQHPNAHDYVQLEEIYAHVDGTAPAVASSGKYADAKVTRHGKYTKVKFIFYAV